MPFLDRIYRVVTFFSAQQLRQFLFNVQLNTSLDYSIVRLSYSIVNFAGNFTSFIRCVCVCVKFYVYVCVFVVFIYYFEVHFNNKRHCSLQSSKKFILNILNFRWSFFCFFSNESFKLKKLIHLKLHKVFPFFLFCSSKRERRSFIK